MDVTQPKANIQLLLSAGQITLMEVNDNDSAVISVQVESSFFWTQQWRTVKILIHITWRTLLTGAIQKHILQCTRQNIALLPFRPVTDPSLLQTYFVNK